MIDLDKASAYNRRQLADEEVGEALALLVAHHQQQHGLTVDGKCGPATTQSVLDQLGAPAIEAAVLQGDHDDDPDDASPISIDAEGWASGENVHRVPSPRSQRLVTHDKDGQAPIGIVYHWTATGPGTAWACARRIAKAPAQGERSASWHVIISRAGEIIQSISFRRGSWHAGGKTAAKFSLLNGRWQIAKPGDVSANALFVGVELENVGEVRLVDGLWQGWPFGRDGKRGPVVPAADVVAADNRYYHGFTTEQEAAAQRLLRALVAEYPAITMGNATWGHVDIDPGRKSDPGVVWSSVVLPRLLRVVFG